MSDIDMMETRKAFKILSDEIVNLHAEIERLQSILRHCVKGPNIVDIGGEMIGLHLMGDGESFAEIRAKAKRMPSSEPGEPS